MFGFGILFTSHVLTIYWAFRVLLGNLMNLKRSALKDPKRDLHRNQIIIFLCFSVLTFHPDKARNLLLAAADDATIFGWNVETGKPLLVLKGHFSRVCALTVHTDGKHVIR